MFVAIHPANPSANLVAALRGADATPVPVADAAAVVDLEPDEGWGVAIVELADDHDQGLAIARRISESRAAPVIVCAPRDLAGRLTEAVCDDFVLTPIDPVELATRIVRLTGRTKPSTDEVVGFKDLALNLATYQATVGSEPVDLTYMEYELLRFFATHQGRVWSREQLLSRVWGYDYFGGARTVDVHVRRLRAKLGEERASWITTVRSVGYRFG
jgi:DNA-binding response OmpR family regulator